MAKIQGQKRVVIENVYPQIDGGAFAVKRVVGEPLHVSADIFTDGHDKIKALLKYRPVKKRNWNTVPMEFVENDRWAATFTPQELTDHEYTIEGWIDHFSTWQTDLHKKYNAGQDVKVELMAAAPMLEKAAANTRDEEIKAELLSWKHQLEQPVHIEELVAVMTGDEMTGWMYEYGERDHIFDYPKVLRVQVDRRKALFSAWYEVFPRSTSEEPGRHGTFKDVEKILPEIQRMGFDVLYFPPIHPIGRSFRKGKDNAPEAQPGEPGSPWAIGSEEGGHKAIHPELGNLRDFKSLVKKAGAHGLEIALDIAFQCSQDHPYVKEHPQWFRWRPDGTVQYAENPPKKYQDVLPFNFETEDWEALWNELKSVFEYWMEQGVKIFRVDNPHTKPFIFWEWVIGELRKKDPEVIFLAEAFSRPRIMERLGKLGFTQSYTYFTWRNTPHDFVEYLNELTKTPMREFYRPNFWPNTPDILPISLQHKGEGAFVARLILAATLSSNYGLYGPVYEFAYNIPHPAREEYIDNEKYELKHWNFSRNTKIKEAIVNINRIRKEHAALQTTWNIYFLETDNEQLLAYLKWNDAKDNYILTVVNLDPNYEQSGWIRVPLWLLNLKQDAVYTVEDLLAGDRYHWQNEWNFVKLHPHILPAHVLHIQHNVPDQTTNMTTHQ